MTELNMVVVYKYYCLILFGSCLLVVLQYEGSISSCVFELFQSSHAQQILRNQLLYIIICPALSIYLCVIFTFKLLLCSYYLIGQKTTII
jgi:hypothetical protein